MRLYYWRGDTVRNTKFDDGTTHVRICIYVLCRCDRICRRPKTRRWFNKQYTRYKRQTWLAKHGENDWVIRHTKPAKNNLKLGASGGLYSSAAAATVIYLLTTPVEPSSHSFLISHFVNTDLPVMRFSLPSRPILMRCRFFRIPMPALFAEYTTPTNKFWILVPSKNFFLLFFRSINEFCENCIVLMIF